MTDFVSGDTGSIFRVTCRDQDDAIINLTGKTVTLRWLTAEGAVVERVMANVNAIGGIAEYQFAADELYAPKMSFEVFVDTGAGIITSRETFNTHVRQKMVTA